MRSVGTADAAPLAHQAPMPEEIRLHGQQVEPADIPGLISAFQGDGAHRLLLFTCAFQIAIFSTSSREISSWRRS
jgi:hypothetical protein